MIKWSAALSLKQHKTFTLIDEDYFKLAKVLTIEAHKKYQTLIAIFMLAENCFDRFCLKFCKFILNFNLDKINEE